MYKVNGFLKLSVLRICQSWGFFFFFYYPEYIPIKIYILAFVAQDSYLLPFMLEKETVY